MQEEVLPNHVVVVGTPDPDAVGAVQGKAGVPASKDLSDLCLA